MIEKINKKILFSLLIFITLILISAFLIEYGLGYKPCKLCIYQRIPYFVAILLIIIASSLIAYLSYFGLETNKFDDLIKKKANEVNQHVQLEFKKTPMTVGNFVGLSEGEIENKAKDLGLSIQAIGKSIEHYTWHKMPHA